MSDLLIPFGIEIDTDEIIEPEDAKKGRACNCKCPGCKAPLLSRHSTINRTHFAHDSKHINAIPENRCDFSGAVAVSMMAMELAKSLPGKFFRTADYELTHKYECCPLKNESITITEATDLKIESVETKMTFDNIIFDYALRVGSHSVLILFTHKKKPSPDFSGINTIKQKKMGVLSISLDLFESQEIKVDRSLRFSDAVSDFILNDGERVWLYHPNESFKLNDAIKKHKCPPSELPEDIYRSYYYQCTQCQHKWSDMKRHSLECPNCAVGHLFIREISK
ncbi:hypothetical protein [Marinicellulosiphila megalodicopiae]|uniref:hypothetical protein n=1 Tax=Marinicellulosiphila megalodicopiae TaxID=2724896 RepID=UPI003BB1940D